MSEMRGEHQRIPGPKTLLRTIAKADNAFSLNHNHPLSMVLIVPEVLGRRVSAGDNALDPDVANRGKFFDRLANVSGPRINVEEVHERR